jgi:hypothetical protein
MARLFSIKPAIRFRGRKYLGVRGWSGKPTHPPLIDFPIVAYVVGGRGLIASLLPSVGQ